jgi:hypothetical protein
MPQIPSAIRAQMKDTITGTLTVTRDAYGVEVAGAAFSVKGRVEHETKRLWSSKGEELFSSTQVYMEDVPGLTPESTVVLPDGSSPKIRDMKRLAWPNGALHLEVFF